MRRPSLRDKRNVVTPRRPKTRPACRGRRDGQVSTRPTFRSSAAAS